MYRLLKWALIPESYETPRPSDAPLLLRDFPWEGGVLGGVGKGVGEFHLRETPLGLRLWAER